MFSIMGVPSGSPPSTSLSAKQRVLRPPALARYIARSAHLNEFVGIIGIFGAERDADAHRSRHAQSFYHHRRGEVCKQAVRQGLYALTLVLAPESSPWRRFRLVIRSPWILRDRAGVAHQTAEERLVIEC